MNQAVLVRGLIGLLIAGLVVAVPGQEPGGGALRPSQRPESLDVILEPIRAEHGVPALAAAVVRGATTTALGAVGLRAADSKEPVTAADLWHLGSCTKSITATLIGILVDGEKLTWSTTIGETFTDLEDDIHADWRPVTIEQLLTHRSGLPEDRTPDALFFKIRALEGPVRKQRRELVKLVLQRPPATPPGTVMAYSNFGYTIAGAMAERVTGKAWEDLVREHIFAPLRMKSCGFGAPGHRGVVDQPRGHLGGKPVAPGPLADNPLSIAPAGGVHASLEDWARYASLHLAGSRGTGHFLRPSTFKKLYSAPAGQGYALGWGIGRHPWAGRLLSHSGSNGMWFAIICIAPEKNLAILVASNTAGAGRDACRDATRTLIARARAREAKK